MAAFPPNLPPDAAGPPGDPSLQGGQPSPPGMPPGGPPPPMAGAPPQGGSPLAALAQRSGMNGSLLQMILTFLAGAGFDQTLNSISKVLSGAKGKGAGKPGIPPPGQPGQPPAGPPAGPLASLAQRGA